MRAKRKTPPKTPPRIGPRCVEEDPEVGPRCAEEEPGIGLELELGATPLLGDPSDPEEGMVTFVT